MYLAPACSLWLLLGIALVEWPRMAAEGALGLIAAKPLLYMSAAAMGFGVNSLAYIVIQLASSLTLKVPARSTFAKGFAAEHQECIYCIYCQTVQFPYSVRLCMLQARL